MKIRHKQSGVELDLGDIQACSPQPYQPGSFWPGKNGSRYDVAEWEEVKPEPVWRDVTAECQLFTGWWHGMTRLFETPKDYRLRKVKLYAGYCSTEQQAAFIIEQREP